MIKKIVLLLVVLLISLHVSSARSNFDSDDLRINHIRLGEYGIVYPWEDTMLVRVSTTNMGQDDLKSLNVRVYIEELGLFYPSSPFDLGEVDDSGNRKSSWVLVDLPYDVKSGEYLVRIVVENDRVSKVRYRYVTFLR